MAAVHRPTLLSLLLLSCATPSATPPSDEQPAGPGASAPIEAEPAAVEPANAADGQPRERVLWTAELDLDGDGQVEPARLSSREVSSQTGSSDLDERVDIPIAECTTDRGYASFCSGTLSIGRRSTKLVLQSGYFGGIGVRVVDIDRNDGRRELLLTRRGDAEEDPPYLFSIVQDDGVELSLIELWSSNGYNSGEVKIDGDGTLELIYDECPDAFTVVYTLAAGRLSAGPVVAERRHDPDQCAACPHVYVLEAAGFAHKGELLRDLRHPDLAAEQRLAFTRPQRFRVTGGAVTIEVREQEPETSFIDAIALEVDGRRIPPRACRDPDAAFCSEDGRPEILRRGDVLSLEFEVGELEADSQVALWAVGYYVPTP